VTPSFIPVPSNSLNLLYEAEIFSLFVERFAFTTFALSANRHNQKILWNELQQSNVKKLPQQWQEFNAAIF
jgi:hypothetical protein